MTENLYASTKNNIQDESKSGSIKLYSPTQIACGTIGGPVGLIYFLRANFIALGNERLAKNTLIYGAILTVALFALLPFLPEKIPGSPFTIAYIIIGRHIAEKYQMTKQAITDSTEYDFQSSWRVLGLGLLCLGLSVIAVFSVAMLLVLLGIWNT